MRTERASRMYRREVGWAVLGGAVLLAAGRVAGAQSSAAPPPDAPLLRPGLLLRQPFGAIEITTFSRSDVETGTRFRVDFLIRNETTRELELNIHNHFRLLADGVPRAPASSTSQTYTSSAMKIPSDSAEYGDLTFNVRGQPHTVHLQLGTASTGRSYARWPD